jgi:hypothetical protein
MTTPFVHNPQRDAFKAIKGFYYQVELTIIRWLELQSSSILYCECGEDIDHVRRLLEADLDSQERLLEQIKTRDRITLRNPAALTAIARFREAIVSNPSLRILYRFSTTASPGKEQGVQFPRSLPGIEAWNAVRSGDLTPQDVQEFIDALKSLVMQAPCPQELQGSVFAQLQEYVESTSPQVLIDEFIQHFEWVTGLPDAVQLHTDIQVLLLEQSRAHTQEEAQLLTDVLTAHVFHLLTRRGEKQLTASGLERLLHERSMTEIDRRLLTRLANFVEQTETYLPRLSSQGESIAAGVAALQSQLSQLLESLMPYGAGVQAQFLPIPFPSPDEPPPPPLGFVSRTALVQALLTQLADVTWLNITGASGMGKTFAARLLAEHHGLTHTIWISLRGEHTQAELPRLLDLHLLRVASMPDRVDLIQAYSLGALPFSQLARHAAHRLGAEGLLVIDELPDLLVLPQLSNKLTELVIVLREVGGKLLTTAQRHASASITERLDVAIVESALPPMTLQDIDEMLTGMDAPASLHHPGFLTLLYAGTRGHPSLIAATLAFLRRQGWVFSEEQLASVLTGDPAGEVRAEIRRKVFQFLPTDHVRELLYRLSLIGAPFDTTLVFAVAAVDPPVPRPGELLPELTGPWLHTLATDYFEVSPLLSNAGQVTLAPMVQRKVHHAVAWHHLQKHKLDQNQALQIILHLRGAHDWEALTAFLCRLVSQLTEKVHAEAFEFVTWIFPSWPDEMPLSRRILFRAAQIRMLSSLETDTRAFITELDAMIQQVEGMDLQAAMLALWIIGPFNPANNPTVAARRTLQACRLYARLPADVQQGLPSRPLESLMWIGVMRIRTHDDIRGMLDVLVTMTEEERTAAFAYEPLYEAPWLLIEQCYALEAVKPDQEQDWQKVLSLMDEVLKIAQLPGGRPLQKLAVRVKALIFADYMGQPQEGLALLEEALTDADRNERFLLHYTAACILLEYSTPEASLNRYQRALAESPTTHLVLYFDALRRAAEAAGRVGQWQLARTFIIRSLKLIKTGDFSYEQLEMLGELTWAHWSLGNRVKACRTMSVLVHRLVQKKDFGDSRFREVFGKTGHTLGWMASLAKIETPQLRTSNGQLYTKPFPGLFSRPRPQVGALPFPHRFDLLLMQLGWFASGCGLYEIAWRKLCEAKHIAQLEGFDALSCVIDLELAELAARRERYGEALSLTISGIRMFVAAQSLRGGGSNTFVSNQAQIDEHWNALSPEQRQEKELRLYWTTIGPTIARLLAKEVPLEAYVTMITALATLFQQHAGDLVDLQFWSRILHELRIAFSPLAIPGTIREQIHNCPASEFELLLLLHLALSRTPNATLAETYQAQTIAFEALLRTLPWSQFMAEDVAIYLLRYWQNVAATQAFALHNPQKFRQSIDALQEPTFSNVAKLLLLAADATATSLSDSLRQNLVRSMGLSSA